MANLEHPSREEMLKAGCNKSVNITTHLRSCNECRELHELLTHWLPSGIPARKEPPPDVVAKLRAIPALLRGRWSARSVAGKITHDSWRYTTAIQLRHAAQGMERRLRMIGGGVTLELVADRLPQRWELSARIYRNGTASSEFLLTVGRRLLVPQVQECFFWSSKRPPRKIQVVSPDLTVDFGELTWK